MRSTPGFEPVCTTCIPFSEDVVNPLFFRRIAETERKGGHRLHNIQFSAGIIRQPVCSAFHTHAVRFFPVFSGAFIVCQ